MAPLAVWQRYYGAEILCVIACGVRTQSDVTCILMSFVEIPAVYCGSMQCGSPRLPANVELGAQRRQNLLRPSELGHIRLTDNCYAHGPFDQELPRTRLTSYGNCDRSSPGVDTLEKEADVRPLPGREPKSAANPDQEASINRPAECRQSKQSRRCRMSLQRPGIDIRKWQADSGKSLCHSLNPRQAHCAEAHRKARLPVPVNFDAFSLRHQASKS